MFNGPPDSAVPAIFLRVSTYGAAVGDNQPKFSSGAELHLNGRNLSRPLATCRNIR